jgi:hypothetical protein
MKMRRNLRNFQTKEFNKETANQPDEIIKQG